MGRTKEESGHPTPKDEVTRGHSLPQNEPKELKFMSVLFHAVAYLC